MQEFNLYAMPCGMLKCFAMIEQCESEATCRSIYLNNVSLDGDPFQCTNVHLIASNVSPKPC